VTSITFLFETSRNRKPREKSGGAWDIMSPPSEKVGGHVPRVPHEIAPMVHCEQFVLCLSENNFPDCFTANCPRIHGKNFAISLAR